MGLLNKLMIISIPQKASQVMGGVDILSPTGLTILTIGILFTVGVPLTMILKGRKDLFVIHVYFIKK